MKTCITLSIVSLFATLALAIHAQAAPIVVANNDFTSEDFSGWTTAGGPHVIQYDSGNPFGWMRYNGTYIEQDLSVAVDESQIYTVNASQFTAGGGWGPSHYIELIARDGGDQVLGRLEGWNPDGAANIPQLQVSGSELAGAAGKNLVIRLGVGTQGGSNAIAGFDDISVSATANSGGSLSAPTSVTILNHSFEDGPDANSATNWGGGEWRAGGTGYGGYLTIGAQDDNSAMSANAYQVLGDTFIEGAVYTLSGHFWPRFGTGAHGMLYLAHDGQDFWGNNTMTDYLDGATGVGDGTQWQQISFEYVATAADAGNQIVVMARGAFWDNIELSYQLASSSNANGTPEPTSAVLALLGLIGLLAGRRRRRRV